MSGRPNIFMPFYVADYLAATGHLSTQEHGSYLLLLFHYWRTGKPLPDDDSRLARISRQSLSEWATVSVAVRSFFNLIHLNGEPVLMNGKLEEVLLVATDRMARQKAASAKANKAKAEASARLAGKPIVKKRAKSVADTASNTVTESNTDSEPYTHTHTHTHTDKTLSSPSEKISPEPPAPVPVVVLPPVIELPTNKTGVLFPITQKQHDAWEELYPSVDVMAELRKMRGWLDANWTKRKTKTGMLKFANAWLARQQDEGGNSAQPARKGQERRPAAHSRLIAGAALAIGELDGTGQVHGAGDDSGHTPAARHPDRESGIVEDSPGEDSGSDTDRNNHPAGGTVHPLLGSGADGKPAEIEIPAFLLRSKRGDPERNQ